MTARKDPPHAGGDGPARHDPVLLAEVLEHLRPGAGMRLVDGTFGAGGYSRAILEASASVLGIDRDPRALEGGRALAEAYPDRLRLVEGRFSDLASLAEATGFIPADGIVLDVGVSSMQLDEPERGFSFRNDGPLDMRMGRNGVSAADVVNRAPVETLAGVIGGFGEERKGGRIARAIVAARGERAITRTAELAEIVRRAAGEPGPQRIHPATRTFQALRIYINRELDELALALGAAEAVLREGGRLVVVTFHSLEDRIVKRFLQDRSRLAQPSRHEPIRTGAEPTFVPLTRRPVEPGPAELAANPRARSARLRAASRTAAPARAIDLRALGVPSLFNVPGPEAFA